MSEEKRAEQVENMIDEWLTKINSKPLASDFSAEQTENAATIMAVFSEIAMIGMKKNPDEWTPGLVEEIMFSRFSLLLNPEEKTEAFFKLIPFSLKILFTFLKNERIILYAAEICQWVDKHEVELTSLYNPKFDAFYHRLISEMESNQIDLNDQGAVSKFTKNYLKAHPEIGFDLYGKEN
ncbi:hypothetical protein R4B61_02640 [Fructilactobacillus vespulae]|uniref:hypothetical protein n=1 Tax=Fructilactobacillus vespulae TaxID=1249630 RepID=UPI0039B63A94